MIMNKTKNIVLGKNSIIRKTPLQLSTGLMFRKKLSDEGMVFFLDENKKTSFHMFFVFFPIDIIFLDENNKIVDMKENFKPFRIYNSKQKAKYAVELPDGTIKKTQTGIGDEVEF